MEGRGGKDRKGEERIKGEGKGRRGEGHIREGKERARETTPQLKFLALPLSPSNLRLEIIIMLSCR